MKYELTIAISILMILGMILVYYTLVIFMSPYEHNSHAKYVDGTNSKTLTYDQFSTINISSTGIPKLIFRTGESSLSNIHHDIHDLYEETIDTNPTYQQIYFNNDDRRKFIEQYYPQYLYSYDAVIPGAFKADIFRILVIHKYGGIYCDMSMKFLIPINDIISDNYDMFLVIEPYKWGLFNGFFASIPNNPLLLKIMDRVDTNIKNKYYGNSYLDITGPQVFGRVINKELNRPETLFYNEKELCINSIKIKLLKLDYYVLFHNAFIKELDTHKFLIQHKLSYSAQLGVYKPNQKTYRDLWYERAIYNQE